MYNNSYAKRGYGDQANKAIYDIRDYMESQSRRVTGLAKSIKLLHENIGIIQDMLQDSGYISGNKPKREYTFSHASSSKKQSKILQDSCTSDEASRICTDKRQSRHGMVHLHDQRQTSDAKTSGKRTTFDVSPPRARTPDKEYSESISK